MTDETEGKDPSPDEPPPSPRRLGRGGPLHTTARFEGRPDEPALPFKGKPGGAPPPRVALGPSDSMGGTYSIDGGSGAATPFGGAPPERASEDPPPFRPQASPPRADPAPAAHAPAWTPPPRREVAVEADEAPSAVGPDAMIDLVWHDPTHCPRMRRHRPWRAILDRLEEEGDVLYDDTAAAEEARRDTLAILTHGRADELDHLDTLLGEAVRESGELVAPLLLLSGTLRIAFDPIERLKVAVAVSTPFASAGEELTAAVKRATEVLDGPHVASAPEVTRPLVEQIQNAFARIDQASPTYLRDQMLRGLLENRRYQRRVIFGADHLCGHLSDPSREAVPTYLPAEVATTLPLFEELAVRIVAEARPPASQFDPGAVALRVVALALLSRRPR